MVSETEGYPVTTAAPAAPDKGPPLTAGVTVTYAYGTVGTVTRRAERIVGPGTWCDVTTLGGHTRIARDGDVKVLVRCAGWV